MDKQIVGRILTGIFVLLLAVTSNHWIFWALFAINLLLAVFLIISKIIAAVTKGSK